MLTAWILAAMAALLALPRIARAADPSDWPVHVRGALIVGGMGTDRETFGGGPVLGADVLVRVRFVEAGLVGTAGREFLGAGSRLSGGLAIGPVFAWTDGTLEALAEAGGRQYSGIAACSFFCSEPKNTGADGNTAYLGLRAGVAFHHRGPTWPTAAFLLGVWALTSWDLRRYDAPYLLSGTSGGVASVGIGGIREIGFALRFGFDAPICAAPPC